jgi:hypothetical protein
MLAEIIVWDPKFDWVAAGTLALAVVTLTLVLVTLWFGRENRRVVAAAEKAATAAEQSAAAAHRPILVPTIRANALTHSVRNVGTGPALNVDVRTVIDIAARPERRGDLQPYETEVPALHRGQAPLAPGEEFAIEMRLMVAAPGQSPADVFEWTYDDVAGRSYRTTARMVGHDPEVGSEHGGKVNWADLKITVVD